MFGPRIKDGENDTETQDNTVSQRQPRCCGSVSGSYAQSRPTIARVALSICSAAAVHRPAVRTMMLIKN